MEFLDLIAIGFLVFCALLFLFVTSLSSLYFLRAVLQGMVAAGLQMPSLALRRWHPRV